MVLSYGSEIPCLSLAPRIEGKTAARTPIMGITFSTDLPRPTGTYETPCLCAQMGEGFGRMMRGDDSPDVRANLAENADPACVLCTGTGVEHMPLPAPHTLDFCLDNGRRLLAALGLSEGDGQCAIADARRALLRARNTDLGYLVRADETAYGAPRVQDDGAIELRPLRLYSRGLSLEGLYDRIARFEAFVNDAAIAGATQVHWG